MNAKAPQPLTLQEALRTGRYRLTPIALSTRCSSIAREARANEILQRVVVDHIFAATVRP